MMTMTMESQVVLRKAFVKLVRFCEGSKKSGVVFSSDEYMKLHTLVYCLCVDRKKRDGNTAELYAAYQSNLGEYLTDDVMPRLRSCQGVSLLSQLYARWSLHSQIVWCLSRSYYSYLDRCYLIRDNLPTLSESGLICFNRFVFDELKGQATETILSLIDRERNDEGTADPALIRHVAVDIFVPMGMGELRCYEVDFEAAMLDATSEYYSRKGASWIEVVSTPKYMERAETALRKEMERVDNYLHPTTKPKVVERIWQELLVKQAARLFENEESGFRALIRDDKTEDLKRIFMLYVKLPEQLQQAAELLRQQVTEDVTALVQAAQDSSTDVIKKLSQLHNRYYFEFLGACFINHKLFQDALTKAFKEVLAKPVATMTIAELIAVFCDEILKKGGDSDKLREEDVESTFETTVQLLTYINDKDMFIEFYRKKLSHRLLFSRSASYELEKSIVAKMKQQIGVEFTSKIECMINDMIIAKENNKNFKQYLSENPIPTGDGIKLSVSVITNFKWPSYKPSNIAIPTDMTRSAEAFAKFYSSQFPDRKLNWLYALGNCHIEAKFAFKTFELIVSTCQALILMLFNSKDSLSYADIKAELNANDDDELVRTSLHFLSQDKHNILLTKKISDDDVFEFNNNFNNRMRRIKLVPPPCTTEAAAEEERKKLAIDVDMDRRYAVDCAIVRIMKARKMLSHKSLVAECIEILSANFKPDVSLIKKRIHDLMERDYIERDDADCNIMKYVA